MLTLQLTPFPVLTTERLILRQLTNQDAPALLAQRSDATIMQYIARPLLQSLDDALVLIQAINEGIRENLSITWGLTRTGSTELIGTVGFVRISRENHRAEVGYLLHPDYRGAGLVHEALMEVIRYGFTVLKLHSIEAVIQPRNTASARVLERAGFVREAAFKQNLFHNGRFLDSAVYSLLIPLAATTEGAEDGSRSR